VIDRSGEWWKGAQFDDLAEYVRELTAPDYPADLVSQSVCKCGSVLFSMEVDSEQGCARRTCLSCDRTVFIGDSAEFWSEADPVAVRCPCGHESFEISVGFSFREGGDVRWITVGRRCVACGILGVPVDWKIDYSPTTQLLEAT
jgi:hypothetical protein